METPYIKVYSVPYQGKEYTIILPKKVANKRTMIYFVDNTIYWQQRPWLPRVMGHSPLIPICKFDVDKTANTLFVVKGNPLGDEGLDNGIFRSIKKYDEKLVNCMSYERFKAL